MLWDREGKGKGRVGSFVFENEKMGDLVDISDWN